MNKFFRSCEFLLLPLAALEICSAICSAQAPRGTAAPDFAVNARKGIELTSQGHCHKALPLLKNALPNITTKQIRYDAAMAMAQCGMSLDDEADAVQALVLLRREFPNDPKVLYTAAHFYSELGARAAEKLVRTDPRSAEAQELHAESLESHGKLQEAAEVYEQILKHYPEQPGIHYRLGRLILAEPSTATSAEDAKDEFEAELKIDPSSASSEFMLGDLARQAGEWDQAILHFGRAAKLDAGFSEAYLGLGISLNAAGKSSEAVAPLEKYVKMEPTDPAGHYQLAIAYERVGRKQDAMRQIALQEKMQKRAQPATAQN